MEPISYVRASNLDEALTAAKGGGRYIAGGTNLFDLMKIGVERPRRLVDISALDLRGIAQSGGEMRIGALTSNTEVANDSRVRTEYPLLSEALLSGASQQLRNMASMAGNLMQRTRCPYFLDIGVAECNKRKPRSGCAAKNGVDRGLSFLGAPSDCIATLPSDAAVPLMALDAGLELTSESGSRRMSLADFYAPAFVSGTSENALAPGELVTAILIPSVPTAKNSSYRKVRERSSFAFALVTVAAVLRVSAGQVQELRVALGSVAPAPWRQRVAEQSAAGRPASRETFERFAAALCAEAVRGRLNGFRIDMARREVVRTLLALAENA